MQLLRKRELLSQLHKRKRSQGNATLAKARAVVASKRESSRSSRLYKTRESEREDRTHGEKRERARRVASHGTKKRKNVAIVARGCGRRNKRNPRDLSGQRSRRSSFVATCKRRTKKLWERGRTKTAHFLNQNSKHLESATKTVISYKVRITATFCFIFLCRVKPVRGRRR
jgi:hypothetical protein